MPALDVRIERLAPMRVAWVRAKGPSPEGEAWSRLLEWAEARDLLAGAEGHAVFGFDNPPPSAAGGAYGYEVWLAVGAEVDLYEAAGEAVGVKEVPGGRYAVTTYSLTGGRGVPETWQALAAWVQTNGYTWRSTTHELERILNPLADEPDIVLDLYLPIEE